MKIMILCLLDDDLVDFAFFLELLEEIHCGGYYLFAVVVLVWKLNEHGDQAKLNYHERQCFFFSQGHQLIEQRYRHKYTEEWDTNDETYHQSFVHYILNEIFVVFHLKVITMLNELLSVSGYLESFALTEKLYQMLYDGYSEIGSVVTALSLFIHDRQQKYNKDKENQNV